MSMPWVPASADAVRVSASTAHRILIVDDEKLIRYVLETFFEDQGDYCVTAATATEGRERIEREAFDAVLCDVDMPGESGLELVRWARVRRPSTAMILMSGIGDARVAAEALNLGAHGFLVKPFPLGDAAACVAAALSRCDAAA
jgi:putative two-component system response regulator